MSNVTILHQGKIYLSETCPFFSDLYANHLREYEIVQMGGGQGEAENDSYSMDAIIVVPNGNYKLQLVTRHAQFIPLCDTPEMAVEALMSVLRQEGFKDLAAMAYLIVRYDHGDSVPTVIAIEKYGSQPEPITRGEIEGDYAFGANSSLALFGLQDLQHPPEQVLRTLRKMDQMAGSDVVAFDLVTGTMNKVEL